MDGHSRNAVSAYEYHTLAGGVLMGTFSDESKSKALRAAIPDAIEIAGTAVRVLNEQFHEEKIQKMAKLILGDDNEFQGKLDKVKGM